MSDNHDDGLVKVNFKIDPPPEPRRPAAGACKNWLENYIRAPRKDRVRWPSKIYCSDRKFSQKTLYEQADQLMDLVEYTHINQ